MDRHEDVVTVDSQDLQSDWRKQGNVGKNYDVHGQDILYMLPKFEHMWDGHLRRIVFVENRNELTLPDAQPINSAWNRAGLSARGT